MPPLRVFVTTALAATLLVACTDAPPGPENPFDIDARWRGYDACAIDGVVADFALHEVISFDAHGNMVEDTSTYTGTSPWVAVFSRTYDSNDRVLTQTWVDDGTPSERDTIVRDDQHRMIRREVESSKPFDHQPDYVEHWAYDARGLPIAMTADRDGAPDDTTYASFTYDASGCLRTRTEADQGSRRVVTLVTRPEDCEVLSISIAPDSESTKIRSYTHTRDAADRLVKIEAFDVNGAIVVTQLLGYDAQDRQITEDTTVGAREDHLTYDYTCGAARARSIGRPVAFDALDARFLADPTTARPMRRAPRAAH